KHGLKKIKHALLSSQETITLPVQAPEPKFRLLFRRRLFAFPLLCLYFIRCSAPRQIGVFASNLIRRKNSRCFFRPAFPPGF
ncbi:hypothetical protein, partial [Nocardiopsis sp. B62]|uniref:hypothetical protein n=1 Tax=Nocardiopsis sp. B62 TaxID=2824874 RepID=UPI001B38398B